MQVFKFGGASVKDAEAVKNISVLLSKQSTKETVMVVSAMAKTTNALEEVCKSFRNANADLSAKVLSIKQMHLQIIHDLCYYFLLVQNIPRGANTLIDFMKDYGKEYKSSAIIGDSLMFIFGALIAMYLKGYPAHISIAVIIVSSYIMQYSLTTRRQ